LNLKALRPLGVAIALAGAMFCGSATAQTETISYTINGTTTVFPYILNSNPWSQTINVGMLPSPSTDTFTDQFNTALTATTSITDRWEFTLPPSQGGTSFSGDQINLSNLSVSGLVDTFAVYSGAPGSGSQLTPMSTTGGVYVYDLTQPTTYYVQVMSTLQANSVGSYSVQLVAAPIPEPSSAAMALVGLAGIGLLVSGLRRADPAHRL
jgi:hypothetical protein